MKYELEMNAMKEYTEELEQEVKKVGLEENLMTCEKCKFILGL